MSLEVHVIDNSNFYKTRIPLSVPPEVSSFINLLFTLNPEGISEQKVSYEDIIRLLKSTELYSLLTDIFGETKEGPFSLVSLNYWVTLEDILNSRELELEGFFNFCKSVLESENKKDLFIFLKETYQEHRNTVYRLGSILVMHILALEFLGKRRC